MAAILLLIGLLHVTGVRSIGVCYGKFGNNLPSEIDAINLYKSNGIQGLRVYIADTKVFDALRGINNIDVIVDVSNGKLQELTDLAQAHAWVQNYIVPYSDNVNFKYVVVGNEIYSGNPNSAQFPDYVLPALKNMHEALSTVGLQDRIKVSTATYSAVLKNTYPPSASEFQDDAKGLMVPIVQFLAEKGLPLLANIYPYFARIGDPVNVPLPFALFTETNRNPYGYNNLFDAMLDAMYYAVQKAGGSNVEIVVSESGWPSDGGLDATVENAATYYRNLIEHVKGNTGTPMKPGIKIETYLFAMFDENQKSGAESEKHFGLFRPDDQKQKYQLNF